MGSIPHGSRRGLRPAALRAKTQDAALMRPSNHNVPSQRLIRPPRHRIVAGAGLSAKRHTDDGAGLTDLVVLEDAEGLVFARFGDAGCGQRAVVVIGRIRVAGEERPRGLTAQPRIQIDAVGTPVS